MSKNSIRIFLLFLFGLSYRSFGQFSYYKVVNGKEILMGEGEHFVIDLNEKLKSDGDNFFIEVDLAKVQDVYKYDQLQFGINTLPNDKGTSYYIANPRTLTFDDEDLTRQRGEAKTFRIWLFKTDGIPQNSTNVITVAEPLSISDAEQTYEVVVKGAYFSKIDRRWQNDDLVLFRVYNGHETIATPAFKISFTYPESIILDRRYKRMMSTYSDSLNGVYTLGYITKRLEQEIRAFDNMETGVVYGTIKSYPNIIEALKEISAYRDKEIRAEPDKKKALEMLDQYNTEFKKFLIAELDKGQLKSINKSLKSASSIQEKIAVFSN